MKFVCELCGFVYDEDLGDAKRGYAPGTKFVDLPEEYECPGCGHEKEAFDPIRPKADANVLRVQNRGGAALKR